MLQHVEPVALRQRMIKTRPLFQLSPPKPQLPDDRHHLDLACPEHDSLAEIKQCNHGAGESAASYVRLEV